MHEANALVQASHNKLEVLPDIWDRLPKLELMRVAVNKLSELPPSLWRCPSLAWVSLASNPVCAQAPAPPRRLAEISQSDIKPKEKLGDGASGDVFCATWMGRDCAVKQFKADDASPDGQSSDEMAVQMYADHANLTKALAHIAEPPSLLLELVRGKPMAEKPNLESLLRCRWEPGISFTTRCADSSPQVKQLTSQCSMSVHSGLHEFECAWVLCCRGCCCLQTVSNSYDCVPADMLYKLHTTLLQPWSTYIAIQSHMEMFTRTTC
jgi:hypothetical protein